MRELKPHAYVFGDGSAAHGDDLGAWAALAVTVNARKLLYGVCYPTTISRCELMPIIEGLRWIKHNWSKANGLRVMVISDSEYTVKTLCGLYERKKNRDLWMALDETVKSMTVQYVWRERNTHPYMELCDSICSGLRHHMHSTMGLAFKDVLNPEPDLPACDILPEGLDTEVIGRLKNG